LLDFNDLWLVRANPGKTDRLKEFLENDIIAIGWGNLLDLHDMPKSTILTELSKNNYSCSNVKLGVINHFVNNIKVDDLCIIPYGDKVYIAKVTSAYYYDATKVEDGYPHQRKVEFINKDNPISRASLPESVRKSLGAQNYVAHLKHRIDEFKAFLSKTEFNNHNTDLQKILIKLLPKAIDNIKNAMDSDDDQRRFIASMEVIKLLQKYE
jgi:predicted Mrr-cat superfamily restriction endonuclease